MQLPPNQLSSASTARQPPPLPPEVRATTDDESGQRFAIGAAVAAALIILVLLMLLLVLLVLRGCSTGDVVDGGGGGTGNSGTLHGSGDGRGSGARSGAGSDPHQSGTPVAPRARTDTPGTEKSDHGQSRGDAPKPPPPTPEMITVQPLDSTPAAPAGEPLDEIGGGGGDSAGTSEFFGARARGGKFVYVVDCSGSMAGTPLIKAREELLRSIGELKRGQRFFVMFFDSFTYPQFHPQDESKLLPASRTNKDRLRNWASTISGGNSTEPRDALLRALDLKPDAIFFLTDGMFDPSIVDEVRNRNSKEVAIHTIAFGNRSGEPLLQQIANENRGTYHFIP